MDSEAFGTQIAPLTVQLVRLLPGPIERVWSYLTDGEKRARWFAGGPMELKPGGAVHLEFRHRNLMQPGEDVPEGHARVVDPGFAMDGEITAIRAPNLLAFSWTMVEGSPSEVVFELEEVGDKVRLTLTHKRLSGRAGMVNVSGGWHTHLGLLIDLLEDKPRRPFWPTHAKLHDAYEQRLPH